MKTPDRIQLTENFHRTKVKHLRVGDTIYGLGSIYTVKSITTDASGRWGIEAKSSRDDRSFGFILPRKARISFTRRTNIDPLK